MVWDDEFLALEGYFQRGGHTRVPRRHVEAGVFVGEWLTTQRAQHKKGRLDSQRQERLATLGNPFDPFNDQWEAHLKALMCFFALEGTPLYR